MSGKGPIFDSGYTNQVFGKVGEAIPIDFPRGGCELPQRSSSDLRPTAPRFGVSGTNLPNMPSWPQLGGPLMIHSFVDGFDTP